MRPFQLAAAAIYTLCLSIVVGFGTAGAQEVPAPKTPAAKIDYSILAQPASAAKANLTDAQRAKIAEILDERVNDLVIAEPQDRAEIVAKSNASIEALLDDEQKQALEQSLQGGKLQFNFFKQKWSAVLKWFAEQAGLSLVMDAEPPGLFTYNDTREFTPAEAIDLLNSVLLSKNFTLIRRERMLVVVDTSTGVPYDLVQQVPIEKLSDFGRFEIVTTEFPLGGRPLATVVEAVTPLVGDHGQVIPLAAAGKLLVTETAGRLKTINIVIAAVPVPKVPPKPKPPEKPPPAVFKTYPAPGLDPEATTDVLKLLFPTAAIRFDPNAQVIHCQAIPAVQASVETSITNLVQSVTGDNRPRMKPYKVPAKQLATLADQITLAHPTLAIDVDADQNRLLVVASALDHVEVAKTLASLGATSAAEITESDESELVLYPVDPESIAVVTSLLEEILPSATVVSDVDRIAVRGTDAEQRIAESTITPFIENASDRPSLSFYPLENPLSTEMMAVLAGLVPEAKISWLAESNRLSVLATLKDHKRVTETLAQIKEASEAPQEKTIAYYGVNAHQRSRFLLIQAELPGDLATMLLMTDASPDEFIAWGTEKQHKQLARLLESLKRNEPSSVAAPQKLDVSVAAPTELVASLKTRFPGVEMVFNEHTDELYVWADGEKFESIRGAFQTIAATMAPREELVMIPYVLENANADAVLTLLMGMRPELNAAADTNANRILVSAPLEEHRRYKTLIEQMDAKPSQANEPKVESYSLKSIDTTTAITVLTPLFPELVLTSDLANQRLVASGATADHLRLAAAIERIDVPQADKDTRLESYELRDADPTQIISVLSQLAPTAIASPNAEGTKVFVWGDEAAHRTIQQAMEQLTNSDPQTSRSMKTYPLPKGAGPAAVTILQPVAEDASLSLDATYENLIAWATEEEHKAIATATDGLHKGLRRVNNQSTELYRFQKSTPSVAYSVLTTLVPNANMAIDSAAAVLVATASPEDHAKIKTVINQLESDSVAARSMKAYAIPKGAGPAALTIMQPVAEDASLSLDANYENLIAWATEDEHKAIASAIDGLHQDLATANEKTTEVYRFLQSTPQTAYTVLSTLIPDAMLAVDEATSVLVATASPEQHEIIRSVVSQIEDDPESTRKMKAYPLPRGAAATAVTIMQPVAADASFSLDETQENLIVWATEAEHKTIGEAVESLREDLVSPNGDEQSVAVYPLDPELISAASLVASLDEATMDRLSVLPNVETNSLIVTGNAQAQEKFGKTIETITSQLKKTNELKTEVYHFAVANPTVAVEALTSLYPDATFAVDEDASVLVATATNRQHQAIATVVQQIDTEEAMGNQRTHVYRLHRANARTVYRAYQMMAPKAQIGYDTGSNVIIATASEEDHKKLKEATSQVEGRTSERGTVKVYRLHKVRADLAASAIQAIIDSQSIEADVHANDEQNSLVVVADPGQQKVIQAAIEQLDLDDRRMEVFELLVNDPFNIERSVKDMFDDMPEGAQPHVSVDFNSSKLFVRGSSAQVEQIRELLTKLGEPLPNFEDQGEHGSPNQRTIHFQGDQKRVIDQIRTVWPKLRRNKIQVIMPSDRGIQPIVPSGDPFGSGAPFGTDPKLLVPGEDTQSSVDPALDSDSISDLSRQREMTADDNGTRLAVFQNTTRAAKPREDDKEDDDREDDQKEDDEAPIVMVADGDSITISSEDTEALDRLESLLKAMTGSGNRGQSNSNFAIFLLRNTGATDTQKLLEELFEALPFHHGGGIHETVVVADDRLNALVVHGNRQGREMVGQLLEVLDSQGLPDPLNVYKSEIFDFKHIHVSRAMAILKNVYKPQLSPGMGKKPIEIPEGVTSTVSSVLQQINASNRGPILTLDMDQTTNSMIMRAPPELRDEIREFAEELDRKGADNTNRSVRVIQLRQGKSEIIQEALQQFIGNQPDSAGRPIAP